MNPPFVSLRPEITRSDALTLMDWLDDESVTRHLSDPRQVTDLIKRGLSPALQEEIGAKTSHYGEIIAPIISPAISNQIRNAQPEMVAALYPIIGQTIARAISEW